MSSNNDLLSAEDLTPKQIKHVRQLYGNGMGMKAIGLEIGATEWAIRKTLGGSVEDQERRDVFRINRAEVRKEHRAETALKLLNEEVIEALKDLGKKINKGKKKGGKLNKKAPVAIVHLSDNHLNELISTPNNTFDFEVAAKRLRKLAMRVKDYAKPMGVQRVVIAYGGDILNSDRRIDEVTNMATNRSRAMVLAVHLYRQFIADLREDFFIDVFGITGNEGRAKQELSWADPGVTDSYDASIYWMLQTVMSEAKDSGLRFHALQGNESVFSIHQETFLLLHGHQVNMSDQRKVQSLIGKHSAMNGTRITHVLAGHIHSAMVSDFASRNSSLSGGNAYSEEALGFCSKASQNLHIVWENSLDGLKLDLQNVDGIEGYNIIQELATHDARGSKMAAQAAVNQPRRRVVIV